MTNQILATKIFIPSNRPNAVSRSALIQRLNTGLKNKFTLISAPAGFGKTTLLSEWISQSEVPFCWISLDEYDNDPGRFLTYFVASLNSIDIEADPEQIKILQTPERGQIETILNNIINQIIDKQTRFAIVFDDYHHIQNNQVHQLLTYLFNHIPSQMHIVISTRADPPLPTARLRAQGQMTEIRSANLRLNFSEGEKFLNQVHELGLSPDDVQKLISRTDGWAAGLQLAAIALRERNDATEYIQRFSGSHDYIVDFLTSEVLDQQSENIQEFLTRTAVLKRLNAPLCETLTDQKNSGQILKELHSKNIFIQNLDDENLWFAYHRLFKDVLTKKLLEKQPDEIPDLFLKASNWCNEHGFLNDAIDYALRGDHKELAADLIEANAQSIIMQSELETFIRWVEKLSDNVVYKHENLCIYYAWALLVSNQNKYTAGKYLDQVNSTDKKVQSRLKTVKTIQTGFQQQYRETISSIQQALDQLPKDDYFFRQIAGWNLSAALFLSGDIEEAAKVLKDVVRVSLASENRMVAIVALSRLGGIRLTQGDLHQAIDYYQQTIDIASENRRKPLPAASEAFLGLGKIQWEQYQFAAANQSLSEGLMLSNRWREVFSIEGRITLAHLQVSLGDRHTANQTMKNAIRIASEKRLTDTGKQYVTIQEAFLQLRQGNLLFAKSWAKRQNLNKYVQMQDLDTAESAGAELRRYYEITVYARLLMIENLYKEALGVLLMLLPTLTQMGHQAKLIETNILIAVAQDGLGNARQAEKSINTALELAAPGEYLRIFFEEGPVVIRLVRQIHSKDNSSEFIQKILAVSLDTITSQGNANISPDLIETLSEREKEILRLLVSDLSVPEIATNIHIAVSTLRTHIRNIYRKLDTHSRFEAVSKAKELKII